MDTESAKATLSFIYYVAAGVGLLLAGIRIVYGWFRDYDNATRFTKDMALQHLPYIYSTLTAICKKLEIENELPPLVNFSSTDGAKPQA